MTERLPLAVFTPLALALSLPAPSTWAATGQNSCRHPEIIVVASQRDRFSAQRWTMR
jgi:hypothetical protein